MLAAEKGVVIARPSGPKDERVCGLGFRPRALVLWWTAQETEGAARGNRGGIGFAADLQSAVAWVSDDAASPTRAARWLDGEHAIVGFEHSTAGSAAMRGRIASFDADGFTIAWQTRPSSPWSLHYLAVGGSDVTDAAVRRFVAPGGGAHSVTGIGFEPDLLLLVPTGVDGPGGRAPGALVSLGAATGARSQVASGFTSSDGVDRSEVRGAQRADAVAVLPVAGTSEPGGIGRLLSMDPDGFTLEWSVTPSWPGSAVCLALRGGRYRIGTAHAPATPGRKRTRGLGFRPAALLVFSWGLEPSPETKEIGRFCLGAASAPTASGCSSWDDRNRGARPSETHVQTTERALIDIVDTAGGNVHAIASLSELHEGGFTLDWQQADGPARQFAYVGFDSAEASRSLSARLPKLFSLR